MSEIPTFVVIMTDIMSMHKGLKNIGFGFVGQVITLILGIIIPRLFLVSLGSAANGLLSSIGQVLSYLTLLEAGLGGASIQALYKPIADKDKDAINRVISATNIYYKKTGALYFGFTVLISLLYPLVVKDFSYLFTFTLVLLSGIPGTINYYFQGKFRVLLTAEGKSYIITNISTIISVVTSVIKIILLQNGTDLITLQITFCIISLLQMVVYYFIEKRYYPWINYSVKPDFSAISQKNSVLIHQVADLILTNTDIIILTIFADLKIVSVYTIYNMIYNIIATSVQTVGNSISYLFGESYYKDKIKFNRLYAVYEICFFAITYALYSVAFISILPFLKLYTDGVSDAYYVDKYLPILFTVMKLLASSRTPSLVVIRVVGAFRETQNSAIIEAIINLSITVFAVLKAGIYGAVIGTIAALLYRTIVLTSYTSKHITLVSPFITWYRWGVNALVFLFIFYFKNYLIPYSAASYIELFLMIIPKVMIIFIMYIIVNLVLNHSAFSIFYNMYLKKLKE